MVQKILPPGKMFLGSQSMRKPVEAAVRVSTLSKWHLRDQDSGLQPFHLKCLHKIDQCADCLT